MTGRDAALLLSLSLAVFGCAATEYSAARVAIPGTDAPQIAAQAEGAALASGDGERLAGFERSDGPDVAVPGLRKASDPASQLLELNWAAGSERSDRTDVAVPDFRKASDPVADAAAAGSAQALNLDDVLRSVRLSYPMLLTALEERRIAAGAQAEAWGAFDTRVTGSAINQPLGFYENYRFSVGLEQPAYWGGRLFSAYRIGRGEFEPWYKERATDEGGEFSAGIAVPLGQNRRVDARRAELWKTTYGRTGADFDVQQQIIGFVQSAASAYWEWVAAGEITRISRAVLQLALDRVEYLEEQVREGRLPPIALLDNQRLIVSREASLIAAEQRLQVAAIRLSLFLRDAQGAPVVPPPEWLPAELPEPQPFDLMQVEGDVAVALANRPELRQLTVLRRQLEVDLALARNQMEPIIDGIVTGSKDVGAQADPKIDDKGPFVLEAGVTVDVPLQRRRGRGRMTAIEGRLAQNAARLVFARDRIVTDVQSAAAALAAAYEQYLRATESVELNRQLEEAERVRLREQRSDLLLVNLREQATADAALAQVAAWLAYFQAQANRRAALALEVADSPEPPLPTESAVPLVPVPMPAPPDED